MVRRYPHRAAIQVSGKGFEQDEQGNITPSVKEIPLKGRFEPVLSDAQLSYKAKLIHAVDDGVRGISLTYGQTTVNGRFVTTGRIKSIDGHNFIDLDENRFAVGNGKSGLDWNVSEKDTLTVKGAIIQKGQVADWVIDEGKITSRDKAATLDSKEGKFSILSSKGPQGRIEMSKDGLYSGHAGIDLKVDGKDLKAAVVGQRGSDEPNAFGGVFQGLIARGLHLGVKVIKDEDLKYTTEKYSYISEESRCCRHEIRRILISLPHENINFSGISPTRHI